MPTRSLPVSKLRARRKKRRLITLGIVLLSLLVLAATVVGLSWLPQLRVHGIKTVGVSSVSIERVQAAVRDELRGVRGGVFARDNILLYPRDEIEAHILKTFPVFEQAEVRAEGWQTLRLRVVEREAGALWCGESLANQTACFLLDGSGVAYAPAADFSGDIYVKYFGAVSTTTPRRYLEPDQFQAIVAFVSAVREPAKSAPTSVEVAGGEVAVTFANGFMLKYAAAHEGGDVLERFKIALKSEPFAKRTLGDFEYLDLRFGDKLYYKLRGTSQ